MAPPRSAGDRRRAGPAIARLRGDQAEAGTGPGLIAGEGRMARNPARMLGLDDRFGSLAVGRRADFVVLGEDGVLRETVLGGERLAG